LRACKIGPADLYAAYTRWCEDSNEHPEKKRRFGTMLTERGFAADNGAKNVAIRKGIALRHDGDPDPSRVNDSEPRSDSEPPDNAPDGAQNVNPVSEREEFVNPRNADTYANNADWVNEVNDNSTTFEANPPHVGECRKDVNLINFVNPTNPSVTRRDGENEVVELLADPPDWLGLLRSNPELIRPTCSAISYEVYGTATRWGEVRPALQAYLKGGAPAA
jgi:hypothetical protein